MLLLLNSFISSHRLVQLPPCHPLECVPPTVQMRGHRNTSSHHWMLLLLLMFFFPGQTIAHERLHPPDGVTGQFNGGRTIGPEQSHQNDWWPVNGWLDWVAPSGRAFSPMCFAPENYLPLLLLPFPLPWPRLRPRFSPKSDLLASARWRNSVLVPGGWPRVIRPLSPGLSPRYLRNPSSERPSQSKQTAAAANPIVPPSWTVPILFYPLPPVTRPLCSANWPILHSFPGQEMSASSSSSSLLPLLLVLSVVANFKSAAIGQKEGFLLSRRDIVDKSVEPAETVLSPQDFVNMPKEEVDLRQLGIRVEPGEWKRDYKVFGMQTDPTLGPGNRGDIAEPVAPNRSRQPADSSRKSVFGKIFG